MWMSPDADPMVMPMTETNEKFGNGLWIMSNFEAGPFQGVGQFGYDPKKEKYVGTWVDNMSPHMSIMEGEYDKEKDQLIMFSKVHDAMTNKEKFTKSVTEFTPEGGRMFTMYQRDDKEGEWAKAFEIKYEKKKLDLIQATLNIGRARLPPSRESEITLQQLPAQREPRPPVMLRAIAVGLGGRGSCRCRESEITLQQLPARREPRPPLMLRAIAVGLGRARLLPMP